MKTISWATAISYKDKCLIHRYRPIGLYCLARQLLRYPARMFVRASVNYHVHTSELHASAPIDFQKPEFSLSLKAMYSGGFSMASTLVIEPIDSGRAQLTIPISFRNTK